MRVTACLALTCAAVTSCTPYALDLRSAPKVPPDERWVTGFESGDDYYLWHCYQGERFLIVQRSSFFSRDPAIVRRGPCDVPLPGERPAGRVLQPDAGTVDTD